MHTPSDLTMHYCINCLCTSQWRGVKCLFLHGPGNEIYQKSSHAGRALYFLNDNDDNDDDDDNNNNNNNNNDNNNNKILKYKDLTIEIQCMWNVKTKVIPVIIVATGTISKSFRKYVSNIPGNYEVKELQKTAILGTAHILRKVLT